MTSFYPPKETIEPTKHKVHRLIGRRRALRYIMMFGSSFIGSMVGSIIMYWLLK